MLLTLLPWRWKQYTYAAPKGWWITARAHEVTCRKTYIYRGFSQNCEKRLLALWICLSVWNSLAATGPIFMRFDIWAFLKNLSTKFKFYCNPARITDTLHEDVFTFMTISRWILLKVRNVSNQCCRGNQNTHFVFNNVLQNRAVYEIMSKKPGGAREAARDNMYAGRKHTPTPSRTYAHTHTRVQHKYVILIAFPGQKWFNERSSVLRYTYVRCWFCPSCACCH